MSIIVPAGNKNVVWSPSEKKATPLVKTAQVEDMVKDRGCDDVCEEHDPLFDAAKEFADQAGKGDGAVVEVEPAGAEKAEGEGKSELKDAVEEVKGAVEKLDVAVEKVEGAEEAEVEIEVDEPDEEVEIEIEDVPGEEEVSSGEVIVTSEPEKCACAKDEKKEVKEAAVEEEFCRFGKLSPVNKKKVADYWTNALGFPKDYVNLMVKDYEK